MGKIKQQHGVVECKTKHSPPAVALLEVLGHGGLPAAISHGEIEAGRALVCEALDLEGSLACAQVGDLDLRTAVKFRNPPVRRTMRQPD